MGADSVIYIRADGNTEIATGHLVRCLSVARDELIGKAWMRIYPFDQMCIIKHQ